MNYYVITDGMRFYEGTMKRGYPICDANRDDAMIMGDDEIATDFPEGLPQGWSKILDQTT